MNRRNLQQGIKVVITYLGKRYGQGASGIFLFSSSTQLSSTKVDDVGAVEVVGAVGAVEVVGAVGFVEVEGVGVAAFVFVIDVFAGTPWWS